MALVPQASGSEALGFWARRLASSTKRLVRRRSPRSASANSLTAQLVVSERLRPDSLGNGLILGCYEVLRPQHTPRASKTKNVGNWQLRAEGGYRGSESACAGWWGKQVEYLSAWDLVR